MNFRGVDQRRVRKNFSGHSNEYDSFAVVQRRVVDRLVQSLDFRADCGRGLEVGCGTGALAAALHRRWPQLPLVVSDLAHAMTCHAVGAGKGLQGVDADAQQLPFGRESFGLVISTSAYQWVNNLSLAFAESWRVLRPGGEFAFALFGERTLYELRHAYRAAQVERAPDRRVHTQNFPSGQEVEQALLTAGFAEVALNCRDEIEWHADVPSLLRGLKKIGAQNAADNRPSGLGSRSVMQRMMELYRQEYGSAAGLPATYEVIYGQGIKPG